MGGGGEESKLITSEQIAE